MYLLRLLPIRFRLMLAHLCMVALMALLAHQLWPATDDVSFYMSCGGGAVMAVVLSTIVSRSITGPLSALTSKLKESQEADKDLGVLRDRASDEIASLYRVVNDYVLYRDNETATRRRTGEVVSMDKSSELANRSRELDHMGLLVDFGKLLSLNYDFGDAASQVLDRVKDHLQLEWGSVMVWDESARGMRLAASVGLDEKLSLDVRGGSRPPVQFKEGEGIAGEVFASGEALIINRGHKDKRFKQFPKFTYSARRISTMACVPLTHEGDVLGVANFINIHSAPVFHEEHVVFLARIAEILSGLLARSSRFDVAFRESVSGLYSPGYFRHLLNLEGDRIKRRPQSLSMVKLDLRFTDPAASQSFKNETYTKVGELIRKSFRRIDLATREAHQFLVCLPGTDPLGALFTAGRIKEQIDLFSYDGKDRQQFATSGGVACFPDPVGDWDRLQSSVDLALNEATRIGDSRVVCFRQEMAGPARNSLESGVRSLEL